MGNRLAEEIWDYIEEKVPSLCYPHSGGRLSFIGHSAGGLVVRVALQNKRLVALHSKLYSYISLATPHVGVLFMDSQLVSTGNRNHLLTFALTLPLFMYCYKLYVLYIQ